MKIGKKIKEKGANSRKERESRQRVTATWQQPQIE